jgi:1-acyl-sn-glycerol-3-phosphate acyltransferase
VERWRSGYWHVAHLAGVPIVPVAFDFALRTVFIGPPITPSDSIEADEKRLRDYVRGVVPKRPELYVA